MSKGFNNSAVVATRASTTTRKPPRSKSAEVALRASPIHHGRGEGLRCTSPGARPLLEEDFPRQPEPLEPRLPVFDRNDGDFRANAILVKGELLLGCARELARSRIRRVPRQARVRGLVASALLLQTLLVAYEIQTSRFQAIVLSRLASALEFSPQPGPSASISFPASGPYDERLGYTRIPAFVKNLASRGYTIERQARISPALASLSRLGLFPVYSEKSHAGLRILGRNHQPLYEVSYPERSFDDFESIPEVLVKTLLFVENRELLDRERPYRNPAVEWDRLGWAVVEQALRAVDGRRDVPGGSTLAVQLEKFRHSPSGRTTSVLEKLRQMSTASVRAYLQGERSLPRRRQILLDYLNSVPLSGIPGIGEIHGLGSGLLAWYGTSLNDVRRLLASGNLEGAISDEQALAYKQVLSLFLAQRRPSFYLAANPGALPPLTNRYIRLLEQEGVISPAMREKALGSKLQVRSVGELRSRQTGFPETRAADAIRAELLSLLDVKSLYELDRLDLMARTTIDPGFQSEATTYLRSLVKPARLREARLSGQRLLSSENDPSKVIYSFTLYERGEGANLLRVETDNFDRPFNLNQGSKLELGSTAKLRTLIHYLEIVAALHERYSGSTREELVSSLPLASDALTRWGMEYLLGRPGVNLTSMLEAAVERRYSASPFERFFTGRGLHEFTNFNEEDDGRILSVREAFRQSVNLVFVRLMRDIVRYQMTQDQPTWTAILDNPRDPRRDAYLRRFADQEGIRYLSGFYRKYQEKSPSELELRLKEASAFASRMTGRVHPLELWLASYLHHHPRASLGEVIARSAQERQEAYNWLFQTRSGNAQDIRIRSLLEEDAFQRIHRAWNRLGYPFGSLVPSYATALGSSGDRPSALADLVGIVLNDGVRKPSIRIESLELAQGTPFETNLRAHEATCEQVLASEIARLVREALVEVVEKGTAIRARGALELPDGSPVVVGGKTGTGDNRVDFRGSGGQLLKSRVMNRTAAFVFFVGDRYFGVVTALVSGPDAESYHFTSSLPVQLFESLVPKLGLDLQAARPAVQ